MKFSRNRLLVVAGGITTIGAAATLIAGTTFGFFSASAAPQTTPQFVAGTVSIGQSASFTCTVGTGSQFATGPSNNGGNIEPGDASPDFGSAGSLSGSACSFPFTYTGSVPAYLGLDVSYTSTPGPQPGAVGLYNPTDPANSLELQVTDGNAQTLKDSETDILSGDTTDASDYNTYTSGSPGTFALTQLGSTGVKDILLKAPSGGPIYPFLTNGADTLYVDWKLPSTAGNAYQGSKVTLTFTVHAVQAANNSAAGCWEDAVCSTPLSWS